MVNAFFWLLEWGVPLLGAVAIGAIIAWTLQ